MGLFSKLKEGLKKTRDSISESISDVFSSFSANDEELYEDLEEALIAADCGYETSMSLCDALRKKVKAEGIKSADEMRLAMKDIVAEMLSGDCALKIDSKPALIMMIGVNGVGKTTSIGKLALYLKNREKSIMLGAADTFRAAAAEQLGVWAERASVPMVKSLEGTDPASVVFDTIASAKAKNVDVIICDTAGRLHNKKNLMDELAKMKRVVMRELPDAQIETLLVLDAATGQNAVSQARSFAEVTDITGIVLTKLDGTAKGGIVLSIMNELKIPVKFVGVGEGIDDLQPFSPEDFANALFESDNIIEE